ncbi:MAG: prolyl oligopeptidase family serine peptidase [Anaerolineae bacterium]|jgi:hypothetical protein|nr:prolyl oligopeptidase family serine peptidase [Anaerolineae bacterium]
MPADTNAIRFEFDGSERVGIYYLAETDQPAPLALLLHGMPGSEKNHDLAHALRALGWHALVIHFGGTWGSAGDYDLHQHPAEAVAALDFALAYPAAPIDPARVAVIGYSMGSRAALMAAHVDPRFKAVVSLAGFSDFTETMLAPSFYDSVAPFMRGATPAVLSKQFLRLGDGLQPHEAAAALAPRPVLVVHGTDDEVVPSFHADTLGAAGSHIAKVMVAGANHVFATQRPALIDAVCGFLSRSLR